MKTRRDFLKGITGALAGFTILPPATTYSRIWRGVIAEPLVTCTVYMDAAVAEETFKRFGEITIRGSQQQVAKFTATVFKRYTNTDGVWQVTTDIQQV